MIRSLFLLFITCAVFQPARPASVGGDSLHFDNFFNPVLYNGRRYSLNLPYNVHGHPFYRTQEFRPGYAIIRNIKFEGLLLNFDVCKQELVLKYKNLYDSYEYLMLSKAWLEEFQVQEDKFMLLKSSGEPDRIYQVIGRDSLKILIYWEKKLALSGRVGDTDRYFSEPARTMYLYRDNEIIRFRNNRDFVGLFSTDQGPLIKVYLSEQRINLKKASSGSLSRLLDFVNRKGK